MTHLPRELLLIAAPLLVASMSAPVYAASFELEPAPQPQPQPTPTSQPETDDLPGPPRPGTPPPVETTPPPGSGPTTTPAPQPQPQPQPQPEPAGQGAGGSFSMDTDNQSVTSESYGPQDQQSDRSRRDEPRLNEGAYFYLTPAAAFMLEDEDFVDLEVSGQWGVGGGYHWRRDWFRASLGLAFEHTVFNFDASDWMGSPPTGHNFRIIPELRAGAGNDRVWGYGLLGFGAGIIHMASDNPVFNGEDSETWAGPVIQVGTGIQGAVWRGLFLGAELDFDLGFYHDETLRPAPSNDDDFAVNVAAFKFLVGYHFGRDNNDEPRRR